MQDKHSRFLPQECRAGAAGFVQALLGADLQE